MSIESNSESSSEFRLIHIVKHHQTPQKKSNLNSQSSRKQLPDHNSSKARCIEYSIAATPNPQNKSSILESVSCTKHSIIIPSSTGAKAWALPSCTIVNKTIGHN